MPLADGIVAVAPYPPFAAATQPSPKPSPAHPAAPDAPLVLFGFPSTIVFQLVSMLAAVVCGMCVLCIVFSSRHLYAKTLYSKMPLLASVCWLVSATTMALAARYTDSPAMALAAYTVGWATDFGTRSLLLWFTSIRVATLWPGTDGIRHTTVGIQSLLVCALVVVLVVTFPADTRAIDAGASAAAAAALRLEDAALVAYLAMDLLTNVLCGLLIARLLYLREALARQTCKPRDTNACKPLFFNMAIGCIGLVMMIHVASTALFATNTDPYMAYTTILAAFRILLSDVFSNLIRDSLIEKQPHKCGPSEPSEPSDAAVEASPLQFHRLTLRSC